MQSPLAAVEPKTKTSVSRHRALFAILLLTVLLYLPSLWFPFVYDDFPQILENPRIQSWRHLPSFFTDHLWAQRVGPVHAVYYRPFFLVWLLANYSLFGANPVGWHLTAVLLHVGVVGLVFAVARRLLPEPAGAKWVALLFALHPAQIEAVAWVSGVPEPLAATFLLGAFLAFLAARDSGGPKWYAVSLILYFAGLLCKETAIIFPAAVSLYELCRPTGEDTWPARAKQAARAAAMYAPVLAAYVLLRTAALEGLYRTSPAADAPTFFLTLPLIAWTYLRLMLLPFRLAVHYDVQFLPAMSAQFWLPLLGAGAVLAACMWWARRSRLRLFAAGWVLVFLLIPIASAKFFSPDIGLVHDRYLYLSLFGFALMAVVAGQGRVLPLGAGAKSVPLLALLAVVYAYGAFSQQFHWRSGYAIFQRALELYPDPRGPLKVLVAEQLHAEGRSEDAGKLYREALQENGGWLAVYGMASWHHDQGNHEEAEKLLLRLVPEYPNRYRQYFLLGMARMSMGRYEEAIPPLGKSVLLAPGSIEYRLQFARALYAAGRLQAAIAQYAAVLEQEPEEQGLRNYVAVLKKQASSGTSTRPGRARSASPPGSRAP